MKTIFGAKEYLEKENKKLKNRLEAIEGLCSPFNIECAQVDGKWGVGLKEDGAFMFIDPLDLVSSIYNHECQLYLDGGERIGLFVADCRKQEFCYDWLLTHNVLKKAGHRFYTYSEYQSKIALAINNLYQKIIEGADVVYEFIGEDPVGLCIKQLAIKWALPSAFARLSSEITIDKFIFDSGDDAEKYYIGLSDRVFQSYISDWDNDYDEIRNKLEDYVFSREAKVRLGFDMSDTIIEFQHHSVLKSVEESSGGYGFKYDELCLVSILTYDFGKAPMLKGYCEERSTIRTFYEGLLRVCLAYVKGFDGYVYDVKDLYAYNKAKSPVIEQWLSEEKHNYAAPVRRQTMVDRIWIIYPEYDVCVEEVIPHRIPFDVEDDTFEDVLDSNGNTIVIPGFSAWSKEISGIIVKSENGEVYDFDWEDYHRRGLELARQLRSKLPSNIDIWYKAPFEDKSATIPRPILIIKNPDAD
ncbi:MAG: hypothetical protein K2L16_02885 [Muribaculaceae bacterium]|nr:hypothetical protein [Muribaculaceae bacterium]